MAEHAIAIKRETGRLPGRTDLNPRRQVNAVILRSGKRLVTDIDKTGKSNSAPILLDDQNPVDKNSISDKNKEKEVDPEILDLDIDSEEEAEID